MPEADPQPPYLKILARWLFVAALIFGGILFSGYVLTYDVLPKTYTTSAEMLVGPLPGSDPAADPANFQSEIQVIESSDVLLPVINELGLEKSWSERIFRTGTDLPDADAVAYMKRLINIEAVPKTNIVAVTAASDLPQEAADIANGIVNKYKRMRDIGEDQRINFAADELRKEIDVQQQIINTKQGDVVQAETALKTLTDRLNKLQADHDLAESPVKILTRADVPSEPSWPNKTLNLIISLVIGAVLAVALASFMEVALMMQRASKRD
jgi:uncharacterized protein involved in exopolysaccharide biosynthesis